MAPTFKQFVGNILEKGRLKPEDISWIVDTHIDLYEKAFTSAGYNPSVNYEDLEQKGDAAANAFLVWYFYKRFPQLNCPAGVPVIARLKIVYSSKTTFFTIAKKLGFWNWINATQSEKDNKEKSLLEDVFEAFFGATQEILDKRYEMGFGFIIVCRILTALFDDVNISLEYEDLYDSKTRLKEYFDTNKSLGKLTTEYDLSTRVITLSIAEPRQPVNIPIRNLPNFIQNIDANKNTTISIKNGVANVSTETSGKIIRKLAEAVAPTKAEAEQKASQMALEALGVKTVKNLSNVCI